MDFHTLTFAQRNSQNQLRFDQAQMERAILRNTAVKEKIRAVGLRLFRAVQAALRDRFAKRQFVQTGQAE